MMIPVTAFALVTHLIVTIADNVPRFDVRPICRGIAQQGGFDLEPNQSAHQDFQSCMKSEMVIRRQLLKQWSTFKPSNKANCIGESSAGGMPSYTGLLTCLQMAKAASTLGQ